MRLTEALKGVFKEKDRRMKPLMDLWERLGGHLHLALRRFAKDSKNGVVEWTVLEPTLGHEEITVFVEFHKKGPGPMGRLVDTLAEGFGVSVSAGFESDEHVVRLQILPL